MAVTAALAASWIGCRACTTTESHVDVPVTLDDVRKLANDGSVVVDVKRREQAAGGAGCGHSAACILLVPVELVSAFFPTKFDEASVIDNGKLTYFARFDANGAFIESAKYLEKSIRYYRALPLEKLRKTVIVRSAEASIGSDGGPEAIGRVLLLPQLDLIADYEAALAKEHGADSRAALIIEAATWLLDESVPFLEKHESDSREPDETRASVIAELCRADDRRSETVLKAATQNPGPKAAVAGIECGVSSTRDAARDAFVGMTADLLCHAKSAAEASELVRALPEGNAALTAAQARCSEPSGRALLSLVAEIPVARTELERVMRESRVYDNALGERLLLRKLDHRAALFAGLDAKPGRERFVVLMSTELTSRATQPSNGRRHG